MAAGVAAELGVRALRLCARSWAAATDRGTLAAGKDATGCQQAFCGPAVQRPDLRQVRSHSRSGCAETCKPAPGDAATPSTNTDGNFRLQ